MSKLKQYEELLKTYNETTNIYSKGAYDKLEFHIANSVHLAESIPKGIKTVADCGSGSGLPAIPLAITRPDIQITAIESKSRKTKFLEQAKQTLELNNLTILTGDVNEHLPHINPDLITAKAFAPFPKMRTILKRSKLKNTIIYIPVSEAQVQAFETENPIKHTIIKEAPHYILQYHTKDI